MFVTADVFHPETSIDEREEQFAKASETSIAVETLMLSVSTEDSDEQPLKIPEIEDTDEVSRFPPNEIDVQFVISLNIFELSEFAVMMPEVGTTEIS